jgi:hypothetical protein
MVPRKKQGESVQGPPVFRGGLGVQVGQLLRGDEVGALGIEELGMFGDTQIPEGKEKGRWHRHIPQLAQGFQEFGSGGGDVHPICLQGNIGFME